MANSVTQLAEKLHFFIQGDEKVNGVFRDQVKKNKQGISLISKDNGMKETIIDKLIADKNLSKLLDLWVKGLDFNWNNLYGEFKPKRMVVPGYPFAKERYWLNSIDSFNRNTAPEQLSTVMHPLLHKRTVTLEQQGYSANFSGTQFLHSEEEPKLMRLPTYPFARQHCWIDPPPSKENKVVDKESQKKFDSIEDIIEQIETEAMETKDAVKMLNVLLQ